MKTQPEARAAEARELSPAQLRAARGGDEEACRALVLRYQRAVFALLSRMLAPVGRQGLVEDLAQETFLRVFRSLGRFDPDGAARPSTWILTIQRNNQVQSLMMRGWS